MKYAKVKTATIQGLKIKNIDLEVSLLKGIPKFEISGINSRKGQEMFGRVKAALLNNGYQIPRNIIICHLSEEIQYATDNSIDMALACAILIADQQIQAETALIKNSYILGGLSLSGEITAIKGVFAMLNQTQSDKNCNWLIPKENQNELIFETELFFERVYIVENINQVIDILTCKNLIFYKININELKTQKDKEILKFIPNKLQPLAQFAIEIAIAGWHPTLIVGSPNSDKSLMKNFLRGLLPTLSDDQYTEIRSFYSLKGLWQEVLSQKEIKPFESPDPHLSKQELLGGGRDLLPGIVTMANQGVLFMEDLNLFKTELIQSLKKPMSTHFVQIGAHKNQQLYPANFLLMATMQPCPCGYYFEEDKRCICKSNEIINYKKKIINTILNQFQVEIILKEYPRAKIGNHIFRDNLKLEEAKKIEERIFVARSLQASRCQAFNIKTSYNSQIKSPDLIDLFRLSQKTLNQFEQELKAQFLTNDFYQNLIRVARTIADLSNKTDINIEHLQEAFTVRIKPDLY